MSTLADICLSLLTVSGRDRNCRLIPELCDTLSDPCRKVFSMSRESVAGADSAAI